MTSVVPLTLRFKRRTARAAVLVLDGASASDARAALAAVHPFDDDPWLIAVDGGLRGLRSIRRRPDVVVGDLDSAGPIPPDLPVKRYPVAKDFSDFAGALAEARRRGAELVSVAALLGGRLDHEWANLFEAGRAARGFAAVVAPGPRGLIVVTSTFVRARAGRGSLTSVFAIGGTARVSLRGTRWPLTSRRLVPGSLGLSNVATGTVTLTVHAGVAALVLPA